LTGAYALACLAYIGVIRYQASTYALLPGFDPRREQQALLALNEGAELANKGELDAAEHSFRRALELWEKLTERRSVPSGYRRNLAMTLSNLGWVRQKKGHADEAEMYYAQAVALADQLAGDPDLDDDFKQTMAETRETLAAMRQGKVDQDLDEKEQAG